jgi:hypothetical protein
MQKTGTLEQHRFSLKNLAEIRGYLMLRASFFILLSLCLMAGKPSWALGPMYGYQDLVAGDGNKGYRDGPFHSALFQMPMGLALDAGMERLYVADKDNHCIRVIDLAKSNEVSTLTGKNKAGYRDGTLEEAAFNQPTVLVLLPDERLLVFDSANFRFRLVDLKTKKVTTLAGSGQAGWMDGIGALAQVGPVWNMAYVPGEDAVYFSQMEDDALRKVEIKSGKVTTLFKGKPEIPRPAALCAAENQVYVADKDSGQVFLLEPQKPKEGETAPGFDLKPSCSGSKILGMAWSDQALYVLQADSNTPVARLLPSFKRAGLTTPRGRDVAAPGAWSFWADLTQSSPMGFIADPRSERKFYIAHPWTNIVTSLRDLNLDNRGPGNSKGLTDFEYPLVKPPHVFRILVLGDSHAIFTVSPDKCPRDDNFMYTLNKKLEFNLNTMAALEDSPMRFEVLSLGKVSWDPLLLWTYYEVPDLVKTYDIDLVLFLLTPNNYIFSYFERPLSAEGIPDIKIDPEFLLKKGKERYPRGLPKEFVEFCLSKKMSIFNPEGNLALAEPDYIQVMNDPKGREIVAKMFGRPTKLLAGKLAAMKTTQGAPVKLEICLLPVPRFHPEDISIFQDVLKEIGAPFMDFTQHMNTFRITYYPLSELDGGDHYYPEGHDFMGFLLGQELISRSLVPLKRK